MVVAAGGIFDHRGLAAALCMGADAVWVGTRFVASEEAGANKRHKAGVCKVSCLSLSFATVSLSFAPVSLSFATGSRHRGMNGTYSCIVQAGYEDTYRTIIYTGRPMRVIRNPIADDWEEVTLPSVVLWLSFDVAEPSSGNQVAHAEWNRANRANN